MTRSFLAVAVMTFSCLAGFADNHADPVAEEDLYGEAVFAYNGGHYDAARKDLDALLKAHPDRFNAYELSWDTEAQLHGETAAHELVRQALTYFDAVPEERRTEDFYDAWIAAFTRLRDDSHAADAHCEARVHFPQGRIVRSDLLHSAANVWDALKAVALYDEYLKNFHDDAGRTVAIAEKFRLMTENPAKFSADDISAAADELEESARAAAAKPGHRDDYVTQMWRIAHAVVAKNPPAAIEYANRGLAYIQERWPDSPEVKESSRYEFWPVLVNAYCSLKQWGNAAAVGDAFARDYKAHLIPLDLIQEDDIVQLRRQYADALDHLGRRLEAAEQRKLAKSPEGYSREARAKDETLASMMNTAAPPFELKTLDGRTVSLAEFRGRPALVVFWATWCVPCRGEMLRLNQMYDRLRERAAVLAISVDDTRNEVPPFVSEQGYRMPVAYSDGSVDGRYEVVALPRLFIIDANGNIRYSHSGGDTGEFFEKQLDWVLDAITK